MEKLSFRPFYTFLEALNFDFDEFLHFLMAEIDPNQKFRAPEIAKKAFFQPLHSLELISCKISVTEKC